MSTDDIAVTRKIQQLGSSTLGMTLPADWVREQGVEKGDNVLIQRDESGGSLLIVPDRPKTPETNTVINTSTLTPEELGRAIRAQYVLGRQLIEVQGDGPLSPVVFEALSEAERRLMGLGIIEEGIESVTIRCSIAPEEFELPTLLERLWRTESIVRSEAIKAFLSGDPALADRTTARRRQVKKLYYLFLRLVFATYRNPQLNHSVGLRTGFPLLGYRSVAQDVLLMVDAASRVATLATEQDDPLDPTPRDRIEATATAVDELADRTQVAIDTRSHGSITAGREALSTVESTCETCQSYLETQRPEPLLALQQVLVMLHQTSIHAADSLDVATHFAFREHVRDK